MKIVVMFDGGVDDDNGAGAAVAYGVDGSLLAERARYVHGGTSNVYEYVGLIVGLRLARDMGADELEVWGDSELIVRQVTGAYECRKEHLRPYLAQARAVAQEFVACRIDVLPKSGRSNKRRNLNEAADALAGECKKLRAHIDRTYTKSNTMEVV